MINVPSNAFNEIKYAPMNTKSETNNANENAIGMNNLCSVGTKANAPKKTVVPRMIEPKPVALENKAPIDPISSVKKFKDVTF